MKSLQILPLVTGPTGLSAGPAGPAEIELFTQGARFGPGLAREDWRRCWPTLREWEGCINWLLGDWLNHGKSAFGEKYALAMDLTELEGQTLRDAAWVAAKVPLARREAALSWSHHREVARLAPRDQTRFLTRAAAGRWTVSALRRAIRAELGGQSERPRTPPFVPRAWAQEGLRFLRRAAVAGWPPARRAALKAELAPIVALYQEL